jgi:tetratricopeptide (TPR) repeat protein
VDQYIELINNFPEDDTLVTEAALYALRYQRQQQLLDFYIKTAAQSPRDYRWSMVLARTQTNLEDYPAAIAAYGKSIAIHPDRADFYTARAGLEERMMRFDEAAADYERIYQLAYKDPQWMEKVAAVRARQGRTKEVVGALQAALIDGRPESAGNYFEVARRLESWGMLDEARAFAERGVSKAGSELLASAEHHAGATTYVRIMTRQRRHDAAFATLQKAFEESAATLPALKEQMEKHGISGVTDAQWRENLRRSRIATARKGIANALQEMGSTVNTYFTPEERLAFANFAESKCNGMTPDEKKWLAIPLAESASLADLEERGRYNWIMQNAGTPNVYPETQALVDLQRRRGRFAELATEMESIADKVPGTMRATPLLATADAHRSAGDEANELRVLSRVFSINGMDTTRQQRYFQLLLQRQPQDLVRIAAQWPTSASEPAADYVIAHGNAELSHAVVQARGQVRPVVWNKSYNALVGLYFAEPRPEVNSAFVTALGDDTIGARLAKPVDRTRQLAGNIWFYYGSRYGEYLGTAKVGDPEDFLPAILEESPVSPAGYLTVADYYAGAGDTHRAIADYDHALELSPNRSDVYDSLAVAYFKQGDHPAALAQWKQALAVLSAQLGSTRLSESFWADFGRTCDQLAARHLFNELRPDIDALLRIYLRRNGNYRSNALLHSVYAAAGDPAVAAAWLIDLSSVAHDPPSILADIVDASWIPPAQRGPIYQRILEAKENAAKKLSGLERQYADQDLGAWQVRWVQYLVRTKQYSAAAESIAALPQEAREAQAAALVPLDLQVAAQLGTLDSKLSAYRTEPDKAPAPAVLRNTARQLFEAGDKLSARKILELVFAREIEDHQLVAANFLGLAEIRLASGDSAGALDLLHRLVVVVGNPFENLDPAAALLEKTGHNAEAVEFLDQLVQSAPWDASYRLRLAKAKLTAGEDGVAQESLAAIATAPSASYTLRINAAAALSGRPHSDLGSGELNLLASNGNEITPAAADKFYFYTARVLAAQNSTEAKTKVQLLSHCIVDFPRRDDARVALFQAAVTVNSDEYALGIMEPLLQTRFLGSEVAKASGEEEQIISSRDDRSSDEEDTDEQPDNSETVAGKITRAQKAQVAQMIGDTMTRLHRLGDAVSYYDSARRLESSPASRKALLRKINDARSILRIEHQNAARQPLLHEPLEQDRVVRPRLLVRITPAPKATAAEGGVKP